MRTRILSVPFAVVMTLGGQNALPMNNLDSLTNPPNKRPYEVVQDVDTTLLPDPKRPNIEESSGFNDTDYILDDDCISLVLSDPNHSNQKLYQFGNIEIYGNIDVLQSKTLKVCTCGTVDDYWNANIIGDNNRGVFLRGKPERATFGVLSLLGPINALRLIPEFGQEISVFTNQNMYLME